MELSGQYFEGGGVDVHQVAVVLAALQASRQVS